MATNDAPPRAREPSSLGAATDRSSELQLVQQMAPTVLTSLLEELACGLLIVRGAEQRVVAQNGRAREWFGPVVGQPVWTLLGLPAGAPPCAQCAEPTPTVGDDGLGGAHAHELFSARHQHWYRCTVRPLRLADGESGRLLALEDVTERRLAELALRRQRDLLDPFIRAQSHQLASAPIAELLAGVLDDVLALTESECGFIGEVHESAEGACTFHMHAVRRLDPDGHSPIACAGALPDGPVLCEPGTPFGAVALAGEALLVNDARGDPRLAGMPDGHPPLRSFLGLPLYGRGVVVGVIGLANRPGGYDEEHLSFLEPLCAGIGGIIVTYRAGQQQANAEQELRESNLFLNEVLGTLRNPFFVIDPATWRVLFAVPSDVLGGRELPLPCHAFLHGAAEPCPPEHCPVAKVAATGLRASGDHVHRHADGVERQVRVDAFPLFDASGQVMRVIVRTRDDSTQPVSSHHIPPWSDLVGRLVGGVVHELANILSAIHGHSELALRELSFDEPGRLQVEQVRRAAQRGEEFTRQLRAVGRRTRLDLGLVSLTESVARLGRLLGPLLGEDVELATALAPDLPFVRADAAQIDRVVLLLAAAAREAMPTGGKLVFRTATVERTGAIGSAVAGPTPTLLALLEMSDSGQGLPPESRARLGSGELPAAAAPSTRQQSVAEVRAIVERHGGELAIDSREGLGTVFRIYLPVAGPSAVGAELETAAPGESAPNGGGSPDGALAEPSLWQRWFRTVLVVDDDPVIRQLTADILEPLGHRVLLAASGQQALQLAAELVRPLDLAIVDLVMPRMSGTELVARLASSRTETLFLLMSGYPDAPAPAEGVEPERIAFIRKPLTPRLLLDAMSTLAGRQQAPTGETPP